MRRHIVVGLIWLLIAGTGMNGQSGLPQGSAASTPNKETMKDRVAGLSPGTLVEVRLADRSKVVGRLRSVGENGFVIAGQDSAGSERQVAFTEARSVKQVNARKSHKKLVIALTIVAGVVVAALAVGYSVSD